MNNKKIMLFQRSLILEEIKSIELAEAFLSYNWPWTFDAQQNNYLYVSEKS